MAELDGLALGRSGVARGSGVSGGRGWSTAGQRRVSRQPGRRAWSNRREVAATGRTGARLEVFVLGIDDQVGSVVGLAPHKWPSLIAIGNRGTW